MTVAVPTDVDISSTWYDTVATLMAGRPLPQPVAAQPVYVLAYRHPLVAAEGFATLDALTGGRAIMGVGAGHVCRGGVQELDADYDGRGPALEEAIGVLHPAFRRPTRATSMPDSPWPTNAGHRPGAG